MRGYRFQKGPTCQIDNHRHHPFEFKQGGATAPHVSAQCERSESDRRVVESGCMQCVPVTNVATRNKCNVYTHIQDQQEGVLASTHQMYVSAARVRREP